MPVLTVHHTTTYRYRAPVRLGEHRILFRPQPWPDQHVLTSSLEVSPAPARVDWERDAFGNWVGRVTFQESATELRFTSVIRVDTGAPSAVVPADSHHGVAPPGYSESEIDAAAPWLGDERRREPAIGDWARSLADAATTESSLDLVVAMNRAVSGFRYVRRSEQGTQDPALTLALRSGSCRDLAMLLVATAQALGFAARFVSGYIRVSPGGGDGVVGGGSTHGWAQILVPGLGWVDFDPTNNIVQHGDLVRVAIAERPDQVVPLSGTFVGRPSDSLGMTVSVAVTAEDGPGNGFGRTDLPPVVAAGCKIG